MRNRDLERLRAVAIIFVLFSHLWLVFPWNSGPPVGLYAHLNFWTGVDLFFVISGFIVTKTLLANLDQSTTRSQAFSAIKSFFIRRIFRIIPLAWLWVVVTLALSLTLNQNNAFPAPKLIGKEFIAIALNVYNLADAFGSNLLNPNGYQRFSPYWSLSIEEQFYICIPFLMLGIKSRVNRIVFLIGALFFIILVFRPALLIAGTDINFYLKFTFARMDTLVCGCLLYFIESGPAHKSIEPVFLRSRTLAMMTFAVLCIAVAITPTLLGPNLEPARYVIVWPFLDLATALLVFIATYNRDYFFVSPNVEPIIQWFASRSYAIYLSHWPSIWITHDAGLRIAGIFNLPVGPNLAALYIGLFILFTLSLAEISHRLVEVPMIRKGHLISRSINVRK